MSRIRTVKPELLRHEGLFDLERETGLPIRIAWVGLLTVCDREGRFEWRPRPLKIDILPYDDCDMDAVLSALLRAGFVRRYAVDGEVYGDVPTWSRHQLVNMREAASKIPAYTDDTCTHVHAREKHVHARACTSEAEQPRQSVNGHRVHWDAVLARDGGACARCGATDDLTLDHIFPVSAGGTHALANLRILCRSCNCARPVAGNALVDDLAKDGLTMADMQRTCMHVHAREKHVHARVEGEGEREGKEEESSLRSDSCPVLKIADASPVVLKIPLAGKDPPPEFGITRQMLDEWGALFPGVDVQQALQSCRAWNLANPRHRKTRGGVLRHVTAWLSREQDRSRPGGGGAVVALPARGLGRQAAIEAANQQAAQDWARAGTDPEAAHVSA